MAGNMNMKLVSDVTLWQLVATVSTQKTGVAASSKTLVIWYQTTRHHVPEDSSL